MGKLGGSEEAVIYSGHLAVSSATLSAWGVLWLGRYGLSPAVEPLHTGVEANCNQPGGQDRETL